MDTQRLVALAKTYHVKVDVLRRVGHFVPAGVPLMMLSKGDRMPPEAMEELRMLSNYQLETQALLQSFLVGQPEFRRMLESSEMQQLRQRVGAGQRS